MRISEDDKSYVRNDLNQLNKLMSNLKLSKLSDDRLNKIDESINRTIELITEGDKSYDYGDDDHSDELVIEYDDGSLVNWIIDEKCDGDLDKVIEFLGLDPKDIKGYGEGEYEDRGIIDDYLMANLDLIDEDVVEEYLDDTGIKEDAIESWRDNYGYDPYNDLPAPWR